jgi:2-dehydro-3-deoxy-D-gluconate 5-dehydrogenase
MSTPSVKQLLDLGGKVAIVTGSAMGIGQAIAFRLAEAGACVTIADIDEAGARDTVAQIEAGGGRAQAIRADVSRIADTKHIVKATVDAYGHLDILVNNAAIYPLLPAFDVTEDVWDKVLDLNLKGMFFCSQAAAREMVKAGRGGKIINIASTNSLHPNPVGAPYDASKGGVWMLTKNLALHWAPQKILVNSVAPGGIVTPGTMAQGKVLSAAGVTQQQIVERRMARQPLGRMGEPDDIAKVVLFLASAAADWVTGSLLLADGGYLLS